MRPKADGGPCLILDIVGNSLTMGLPDEVRQWDLDEGLVVEKAVVVDEPDPDLPKLTRDTSYFVPGELRDAATLLDEIAQRYASYSEELERFMLPKHQLDRLISEAWRSDDPRGALELIRRQMGYKPGWVWYQLNQAERNRV